VTDAARRFWAALGETRRAELGALPEWGAWLEAALVEGARAGGWISRGDLAAEVAARLEADDEEARRWWAHLHGGDLALASACARGLPPALGEFERRYGDELARTARRFERGGLPADDLLQRLRAKLFAAGDEAGERRPRITAYAGQGFLQNWVRVTATRFFIDCARSEADAPEVPIADGLLAGLREPGADAELALLKREHALHFQAAFAEAVGALDGEARAWLRQHVVERLTIDQLGALYHLHRATAARRLAKAREALLGGARVALARRLGVPPARLGGALALLASRLEVSLERLLR
jgi:RNA polymerase sigma-70 factor (ECF subfamily)